ncbi:MAG: hypothetical protein MSA15_21320 [Clostridium sp.]|nr:hypothetical protein [Clostridium sp.]
MSNPFLDRAKSNNNLRKLNETTAIENKVENTIENKVENNKEVATTKTSRDTVVESIKISNRKARKRINVSMNEDVFHKLITVANGRSVSAVMEKILMDAVKDTIIDREIVEIYLETMKNKGQK